ncbi:MAG: OmpA family protein [Pseudomonadota bacterium]
MSRFALFPVIALVLGMIAWEVGRRGADAYERMLAERVSNGLEVLGYDWAEVRVDGLALELHGHAPDMFARDLAEESAEATAPLARVENYATAAIEPPEHRDPVRVELHRDQRGVTMTGQTASRFMRQALNTALAEAGVDFRVYDLTGIQAATPPIGWGPEISIAAMAAAALPNAYVVLEPGRVLVDGQALGADDLEVLTAALTDLAGDRIELSLRLRIPAEIIAPFEVTAEQIAGGPLLIETCAARTGIELDTLHAALDEMTVTLPDDGCRHGLGGPAGNWPGAILAGLETLQVLPAGRMDLAYRTVRLTAAPPTTPPEFEAALAVLRQRVPEGYVAEGALAADDVAGRVAIEQDRYWMNISRSAEGLALSGQVPDDETSLALRTYASALFGTGAITADLAVTVAAPPSDWQIAAMAAMDQLALGGGGTALLAGYSLSLRNRLADPGLARQIHQEMALGLPDYRVTTVFDVDLPGVLRRIPLPAARCADRLNRIYRNSPIDFDTGSTKISAQSEPVLDVLAALFARCTAEPIEIGGHTDAQGSEEVNLRISQQRADAVATALVARGVPIQRLRATGFGEAVPIADNQTDSGRARNRRIEFKPVR